MSPRFVCNPQPPPPPAQLQACQEGRDGKIMFWTCQYKPITNHPHVLINKIIIVHISKIKTVYIFASMIFSDSGTSQRQLGDDDGAIRHRTFSPPLFTFELNSALCLHRNFHFLILIAVVATSQWNIGGNEPIRTICKCCSILPNGSTVYKNQIFILFY